MVKYVVLVVCAIPLVWLVGTHLIVEMAFLLAFTAAGMWLLDRIEADRSGS